MLTIIMLDIKVSSKWRLMLKVSYFLGFMETTLLTSSIYTLNVLSKIVSVLINDNGKWLSIVFS